MRRRAWRRRAAARVWQPPSVSPGPLADQVTPVAHPHPRLPQARRTGVWRRPRCVPSPVAQSWPAALVRCSQPAVAVLLPLCLLRFRHSHTLVTPGPPPPPPPPPRPRTLLLLQAPCACCPTARSCPSPLPSAGRRRRRRRGRRPLLQQAARTPLACETGWKTCGWVWQRWLRTPGCLGEWSAPLASSCCQPRSLPWRQGSEHGAQPCPLAQDKVAAPAGKVLARGSSLVGRTASSSVKAAAAVGGGGVKAASVMGGGGVRAAAFVGGGVAATAQATAYTAHTVVARAVQPLQLSPPRLPGRGTRATKSDAHLPVAASPPPAVGEAAADSQPSAGGMQRLMRVHSSPDASLDVGVAPPEGEAGAAQPPARPPHKAPVRALLRQSSSVAAAVLSRLSRSSGSTASRRQRSTLGQSAQHAEQSLEDAAEAAVAAVEAERAAGAAPEAGQAARRSSIQPAASAPVLDRQQQERRMHEQALAGLALLAGPAGALRPPELPSASGAAEVAELRLQEQLAMYQHRRKPSLPQDWEQRMSAAAPPLPDASTSSVLRTSTAPPAVTAHLARVAAEHRRQQQQQPQQEQQQQQPLPPQQQQPEGPQKPAEQAMPCVLGLESAGACDGALAALARSDRSGRDEHAWPAACHASCPDPHMLVCNPALQRTRWGPRVPPPACPPQEAPLQQSRSGLAAHPCGAGASRCRRCLQASALAAAAASRWRPCRPCRLWLAAASCLSLVAARRRARHAPQHPPARWRLPSQRAQWRSWRPGPRCCAACSACQGGVAAA